MKLVIVLFLGFISPLCLGQTKPPASVSVQSESVSVEKELQQLITRWNEAELKGDAVEIEKLLAPEFSFLGGSTRAEYLDSIKPDPSLVIESNAIAKSDVNVYGNAAVVTSLTSYKVTKSGQPFAGKFLTLTVWIKEGRWRCVKASIRDAKD